MHQHIHTFTHIWNKKIKKIAKLSRNQKNYKRQNSIVETGLKTDTETEVLKDKNHNMLDNSWTSTYLLRYACKVNETICVVELSSFTEKARTVDKKFHSGKILETL